MDFVFGAQSVFNVPVVVVTRSLTVAKQIFIRKRIAIAVKAMRKVSFDR